MIPILAEVTNWPQAACILGLFALVAYAIPLLIKYLGSQPPPPSVKDLLPPPPEPMWKQTTVKMDREALKAVLKEMGYPENKENVEALTAVLQRDYTELLRRVDAICSQRGGAVGLTETDKE